MSIDMNLIVGHQDLLFITLDTLRYDVAAETWRQGKTPCLNGLLPKSGWELRHSPGSFTYAAHAAFFAGFLPTPVTPGPHPRRFALNFPGSETTDKQTCVLESDNLVHGLAKRGYRTICIGGVGFFNKLSPLGSVFPSWFNESHWSVATSVTELHSTENQIAIAIESIARLPADQRLFLFINVSALHQPNCGYVPEATQDSPTTQAAALEYVDRCLPRLIQTLQQRSSGMGIVCSDHGTAYGEAGYQGHRVAHEVVWNVPYAEFFWDQGDGL
jgi:hypothetical protein